VDSLRIPGAVKAAVAKVSKSCLVCLCLSCSALPFCVLHCISLYSSLYHDFAYLNKQVTQTASNHNHHSRTKAPKLDEQMA
jgi:hypothetical protein